VTGSERQLCDRSFRLESSPAALSETRWLALVPRNPHRDIIEAVVGPLRGRRHMLWLSSESLRATDCTPASCPLVAAPLLRCPRDNAPVLRVCDAVESRRNFGYRDRGKPFQLGLPCNYRGWFSQAQPERRVSARYRHHPSIEPWPSAVAIEPKSASFPCRPCWNGLVPCHCRT